jgi:hypothetical protein
MWYYDLSPDRTQADIVDSEGDTVATVSADADLESKLHLMVNAPRMLDALRALAEAVKQYAPLCKDRPEYAQARAAIDRATRPLALHYVQDAGHGWVGVDYDTLDRLGIANEISAYSYRGQTVAWLEEDRDAEILLRALSIAGITYRIRDEHIDGDAPIRMLPRWTKS